MPALKWVRMLMNHIPAKYEHLVRLEHLKVWPPRIENRSPAGPDPPWPEGQTIPLTYHPVPDSA